MKTLGVFLILFLTLFVLNFVACQESPTKEDLLTEDKSPVKRQSDGETSTTQESFFTRFLKEFAKFRHGVADGWGGGESGRVFSTGEEQSLSYRVGKRTSSILRTLYNTARNLFAGLSSRTTTTTTHGSDQN